MEETAKREKLSLKDTIMDVVMKMSDGNPGAITVLMEAFNKIGNPDEAFMWLLTLDDMNIRGSQIWLGYKDHCKEDMSAFIEAVKNRDADMVSTINGSLGGPSDQKAVVSGGSFRR